MVHWCRKYFEFRVQLPNMSWAEQLPLYLKNLNELATYQDWQIRQADQAIRLYFSNFLMSTSSPEKQRSALTKGGISTQQDALQSFLEGLRLRNYAVRTEKTYTGWVRRYFSYCKTRNSPNDNIAVCTSGFIHDYLARISHEHFVASTGNGLICVYNYHSSLSQLIEQNVHQRPADMITSSA